MILIAIGKGIQVFKYMEKEVKFELVKTIDYDALDKLHYKILK